MYHHFSNLQEEWEVPGASGGSMQSAQEGLGHPFSPRDPSRWRNPHLSTHEQLERAGGGTAREKQITRLEITRI